MEDLTNRIEWIADPAHAWLKVPRTAYDASNVHASPCSYQDAESVYLEEDMDAPAFMKAVEIVDWYIPRREFPQQQRYSERNPRDLERLVDTAYVNPFAHLYTMTAEEQEISDELGSILA